MTVAVRDPLVKNRSQELAAANIGSQLLQWLIGSI